MSIRTRLTGLPTNSSFVFLLGMAAGMGFGRGAEWTEHALLPVLGVIMTVSILDISLRVFLDVRNVLPPVLAAIGLSFVALGGSVIGLSSLIIDDAELRNGFVIAAAVPPAVAVIPLTYLLGGNTRLSLIGNVGAYVAGLGITPLICLVFLGSNLVDPMRLLTVLGELIVVPIVVSRLVRRTPVAASADRWRGLVVTWGFFLVIYTIVGLNRDTFLEEPETLLLPAAVAFWGTFVIAELINRVSRAFGVEKADRISLMLLGARKNDGLAGGIALVFLGPRAALPAAVTTAFNIIHFIWLAWWVKRMR
jgi:BASS family bile acid:Na+ symporter